MLANEKQRTLFNHSGHMGLALIFFKTNQHSVCDVVSITLPALILPRPFSGSQFRLVRPGSLDQCFEFTRM